MGGPSLSVTVFNFGSTFPASEWHRIVDLGRAVEDAGADRVVVVDHVVMGEHLDAYAWGRFPTGSDGDWLEPLAVLAAMAAVTSTIRLGTGILIAPLRPAALLAKTAATIDVLSQGRLELGVGTGWQREEYEAEGLSFDRRGQLLTDTLEACQRLWADAPADVDTETVKLSGIYCRPRPAQPGGVPLWIGGTLHPRNMERIIRFGRGWIPIMGESTAGIAAGVAQIRVALEAAGRDPGSVVTRAPLPPVRVDGRVDLERSLEAVPALLEAGAGDILVSLQAFCPDLADAPTFLKGLTRRFRDIAGPPVIGGTP
jgi:probable F420-dependent oxidoreductase